jgi:uncharacterized protein YbjT (DUF2867 family)
VTPKPWNEYYRARWRVERELRASPLLHTIVRPALITGSDREEFRPAERVAAVVLDGLLGALRAVGLPKPAERYGSITASELATALVRLARDPNAENQVIDAERLREQQQGGRHE